MMRFVKIIANIRLGPLVRLVSLVLRHPFMLWPTVKATRACLRAADLHFGKQHHRNTPANAFRHAYWNFLIAHECYNISGQAEKSALWAQAITDWHEEAFVNHDLAKQMDLHNNAVGRTVFLAEPRATANQGKDKMLLLTTSSKKLARLQDIPKDPVILVHLETPL
jgi:hypothetical protein